MAHRTGRFPQLARRFLRSDTGLGYGDGHRRRETRVPRQSARAANASCIPPCRAASRHGCLRIPHGRGDRAESRRPDTQKADAHGHSRGTCAGWRWAAIQPRFRFDRPARVARCRSGLRLALAALRTEQATSVIALRQLSIVFGAALGGQLLKEAISRTRARWEC